MGPQSSIAHYRITAKLGEGGMGEVWRATDTKLGRDVAIKVLPDSFAADPDRLARFTREAQVLASLNHTNIAAIYGVEDRAIVMELVDGQQLTGPMPLDQALPLIHQLIDALEYAHEKGVVHRDLKPANLKVTPDGQLKVLDFGLAKAIASEQSPAADPRSSPTLTMSATMAGMIMGTAAYMAPEQARGHAVDRRADIWAFGAVVYELLTGRVLFDAPTVSDTLAAVLMRDPDLSEIPEPLRRLLRLCLARDPKQRLRDISAARLLLEMPVAPAAVPVAKRRPYLWIAAVALLTALAAAGWLRSGRQGDTHLVRLPVNLGPFADTMIYGVQISPDGQRIVYGVRSDRGYAMVRRDLNDNKTVQLSPLSGLYFTFSPDGQSVAIALDAKLARVSVNGGAPAFLCDAPLLRGATWGKDGYLIASLDGRQLSRISEGGGAPQVILTPEGDGVFRWPQLLPGDDAVLFTSHNILVADFEDANIEWLSLKTGKRKVVQRGGFYGRYLPSGHLVYVHRGTLFGIRFDPVSGETSGTAVPLLGDVAANTAWGAGHFSFSDTGTFIYASGNYELVQPFALLEASGRATPLAAAAGVSPRLSPDGKRMAEVVKGDLFVFDLSTETSTRITFNPNQNVRLPVWSPDGRHLIYTINDGVFWTRSDGSGGAQKLLASNAAVAVSLAPDGRLAYHQSGGATNRDIWTVKVDWSNPDAPKVGTPELILATPGADVDPTYSPDGSWLAYATNEGGGDYHVYVRSASGPGLWQVSEMPGRFPVWSHKTNELFFMSTSGYVMLMDYKVNNGAFAAGKPRQFSTAPIWGAGNQPNFDVSPDGSRVVASPLSKAEASSELEFLLNFFDEVRRRVPGGK